MIKAILVGLLLISVLGVSHSRDDKFQFSGSYISGSGEEFAFDILVPPQSIYILNLDEGHQIQFETPEMTGNDAVTTTVFLAGSGATKKIAHKAETRGGVAQVRSYGYTSCDSGPHFSTPASANSENCRNGKS